MTSNRIKEVALTQFAKNGYDGASLADIASEVGIKKQSIYTHFKGKDELFMELFQDTLNQESQFVRQYLDQIQSASLHDFLHGFLLQYHDRYEDHDMTKFFLRTAFFPPSHLHDEIAKGGNLYIDQIGQWLVPIFDHAKLEKTVSPAVTSETAALAFIAVLDGMFVEMLFMGKERSLKRIDASWFVFYRGIQMETEGS